MLKKTVCSLAMAAAAVLTVAAPASAVEDNEWNGAVNLVDANQFQVPICVAQNNVGVLGAAVPILSPMFMGSCAKTPAV
ncbi:hypothetical protein GCM10010297_18070 [Streptomyces malachitofuscus]|nr:hypothetical protein GCM10010297_18070 [Streptomyces malachitofuscus]